jgi:hypothetical protein
MNVKLSNKMDDVTLAYLTKPSYQNNIQIHNINNTEGIITKDDKKFYKKRILSITKELFYKTNYPQSIKNLHNSYISQIVEYFQICDKEDILQEEYDGMEDTDGLPNIDNDLSIDDANKGLFNNISKENTIDEFVTIKQINITPVHIPKQKNIDLKTPEFKMKGVKQKNKKT